MTIIPNGGPAFPQWDGHAITSEPQYLRGGMSLRDYFAGQQLAGASANPAYKGKATLEMAKVAYEHADNMLAVRNKNLHAS